MVDNQAQKQSAVEEPSFERALRKRQITLSRKPLRTLQINVGKLCNQACLHCHVEAGPKRTEIMPQEVAERIIWLLERAPEITTVDITGGAPELVPCFRYLVEQSRSLGKSVIDRCNLTIFFEEGQDDLPDFLKAHEVTVVASLPCYSKDNVDSQRGKGVFDKSIEGLQWLNRLGYGKELDLYLVYNPLGAYLPPEQAKLEQDYKKELKELFDIEFTNLFTITNMPISRFRHYLEREGKLQEYFELLAKNFNSSAVESLMCRDLLSISWTGEIYDCDFNQMIELPIGYQSVSIFEVDSFQELLQRKIALGSHCFGCTAGAGSSCGGALV